MKKRETKEQLAAQAQVHSSLEGAKRAEHHDLQEALRLAREAQHLAQELNYAAGISEAVRLQLHQHLSLGQIREARALAPQALEAARESGCERLIASALHAQGRVCHYAGASSEALLWYQQALAIRETFENLSDASGTLNNMALVYDFLGQRDQALDCFARALQIRKAMGWRWGEAQVLNNLGNLYLDQEQWERAKEYYDETLKITVAEGDLPLEVTARLNLTEVARQLSPLPEALDCSRQALRVIRKLRDQRNLLVAWAHRGMLLGEAGKHRLAQRYLEQAYTRAKQMADSEIVFLVAKEYAHYHARHGSSALASRTWEEGLERAERSGLQSQALYCHKSLATLFEQERDYPRALYHFQRFHELEKKHLTEATERFRQALQVSFELDRARQRNEQLAAQIDQDGMTGLLNHQAFHGRFRAMLETKYPLALLLLDVDRFKSYNDTFGHPAGDTLLKHLAATLTKNTRPGDVVARYGGEEFAILLPSVDRAGAIQLAERLQEAIRKEAFPLRSITVSMGLALCPPLPCRPEILLQAADQALYAAKRAGRDRWVLAQGLPVGEDI